MSGDGFAADSTVLLTLLRNDSGAIAHEAGLNSDDNGAMEAIIEFEPLDPGPHTANAIGPSPDGATVQLSGAVVVADEAEAAAQAPAPAPAPAQAPAPAPAAPQADVSPAEVAEASSQDSAADDPDADAGSAADDATVATDPTQAASAEAASSEAEADTTENEQSTDAAAADVVSVEPGIVAASSIVDDGSSSGIWVGVLLAAVLAAIAASIVVRRRNGAPLGVHHTSTDT